jgi:murein DD-endopeptidase MepM/ murein hydrolase activator NlpD
MVVIIFLYMLRFREYRKKKLMPVTIQEYSPERNLYSQKNSLKRFRGDLYLPLSLPFMGEWTVTQGHSGEYTHQDAWKHAWDFEIRDEQGNTFSGKGSTLADFFCYNKPVLAAADGWVEETVDNVDDNLPYEVNLNQNWGNTIIIRHLDGLYTKTCHLKKGSLLVGKGAYVRKGDKIALCGNSGRSPRPHVHFQVQSTPFIGSPTLDYPFGRYIKRTSEGYELSAWEKPGKDELLSNIDRVTCLDKAFNFVPGQKVSFRVSQDNMTDTLVTWQVEIDIYNYTYLHCLATGSKAYFRNEPDLHIFTWFQGDRNSLLYEFYLGAYKVVRGFYPGLQVIDEFPLFHMKNGVKRIMQDFIAPFHIFIRSGYTMIYEKMEDEISQTGIHLSSVLSETAGGKSRELARFSFFIDHNRIEKFVMNRAGKEITATVNPDLES